jgi:hypothetical protein
VNHEFTLRSKPQRSETLIKYVGCLAGYAQFQYRESRGGAPKMEFTPPGAFALEYRAAMAALSDVPQRRIVYHVCCEGKALQLSNQFASARTAQRRGMPLLLTALELLADHFQY